MSLSRTKQLVDMMRTINIRFYTQAAIPIIFTKVGFQNLCQIELYQSSATVFHKRNKSQWKGNRDVVGNLRGGRTPTTDVVGTAVGRLLADSSSWALCFPPSPEICPKANVWRNTNITPEKYKQKYKKNTVPKVREIQTKTQILRGDTETQIGSCLFFRANYSLYTKMLLAS